MNLLKREIIVGCSLLLACVFTACKKGGREKQKVNILFLMSDQHRGDFVGAAGADWLETPNLDQLAQEGVLFENAYTSVPSCYPARTALLTGRNPWGSGQLGYHPIPDYKYEMPKMITNAGYRTYAVGKMHFTPMRNHHGYQTMILEEGWQHGKNQGKGDYTQWFEKNYPKKNLNASGLGYTDHRGGRAFPFKDKLHPTHWTADQAIQFLKSYQGRSPWLLKVSFQRPHPPFDPPKRWLDHYKNVAVPAAKVGRWAKKKYKGKTVSLKNHPNLTSGIVPKNQIQDSRQTYAGSISFVDEQIGRVIDVLKNKGELENTLIIYTSDHGDMMGDQHMWRKCRPYEGSARIPMIIRWPKRLHLKASRGQIRNELVELRDVAPTFLDVANIPKPKVMDGASMLNILKGESWRKMLGLEHSQIYEPDNAWTALTDGRYKYIYFTLTGQQQLFDLKNDPYELHNLASENNYENNKKLVQNWRKKMVNHLKVRGDRWVKNDDLVVQKKSMDYGTNYPGF